MGRAWQSCTSPTGLSLLVFYPGRQLGMGGAGLSWGEAVGSLSTELVPGAPSAPDTNC